MSDHILVSTQGAVQTIRFNRPDKKNAITRAMYGQMTEALSAGEADDSIRCHVILGTPGAFSSGNDLQDFMAFAASGDMGTEVFDFLNCMSSVKKPFISGVDGLAIGIGTTIHMHCDLTFATPQSLFKTPFVDLGLVPEAASSLLAPAIMGHQRAYALLAMGEPLSAEQARDAGLIYQVVEADALESTVADTAEKLAARAPQAMAHAKRLMRPDTETIKARILEEGKLFAEQLKSDEAKAAFMAFMTRKK
ncbi:crotonase/enoyl-CoA hydratase family protein [Ahrensia marina]|uniref:Enoyl-CoA hydratase n=1 Tax=Ahrensia marina TaxID=1514904 RepID=A0A0N0E7F5_9HYPH|nr:crotonase/enoyl-CoA hydratase family protein [Ahrensia marina]KPB01128.1 enoyl-CoA hydratase [Ahrensia marina]